MREPALPLIQETDNLYEQLVPENHVKQKQKATETPFHIVGTSFTTATLNVITKLPFIKTKEIGGLVT